VKQLCAIAGVSRKSYYAYLKRRGAVDEEFERILAFVRQMQAETCFAVGYRPMTQMLRQGLNIIVNHKRVHAIMMEYDLLSYVRRKKYTPEQYKRRREMKDLIPKNLLKRRFFALRPRQVFVGDITYLYCLEQMMYLKSIVDLYNRQVVAWVISENCDEDLCMAAVVQLSLDCKLQGCMFHNDQGSTYTGYGFQLLLNDLRAVPSCSDSGKCWDNSSMESFHAVLKTECLYNRFGKAKFKDRRIRKKDVLKAVIEYIPYYNQVRLKKDLGWMTPEGFLESNPEGTELMVL
jgi:transposase InsO family protein